MAVVTKEQPDRLKVQLKGNQESFVYQLKTYNQKPWPETLDWQKGNVKVHFEFFLPDGDHRSPLRWNAESESGKIKLKWNTRQIKI